MTSPNRFRFRAWIKDAKEMIDVGSLEFFTNGSIHVNDEFPNCIVMQSTGLTDRHGVEIFCGDVVKWDDASGGKYWRVAEVVWSERGCWCFRTIPSQCVNCCQGERVDFLMGNFIYTPDTGAYGNVMEIIGNLHQHPHLLK
jgi:uncharacterized phage protein (TIGR01671 family)